MRKIFFTLLVLFLAHGLYAQIVTLKGNERSITLRLEHIAYVRIDAIHVSGRFQLIHPDTLRITRAVSFKNVPDSMDIPMKVVNRVYVWRNGKELKNDPAVTQLPPLVGMVSSGVLAPNHLALSSYILFGSIAYLIVSNQCYRPKKYRMGKRRPFDIEIEPESEENQVMTTVLFEEIAIVKGPEPERTTPIQIQRFRP